MEMKASRELDRSLLELVAATIEQCAQVVEGLPASASLYESARIAEAVISFKKMAAEEIRRLAEPVT